MAQDAELKLKVSLDLGFFRQQLAGLGQAAAGYNIPVQVKFDRRSVQNELNTLGTNIRRRNYVLEVKTNLKSEIDNAETLAKALVGLERLGQKNKGAANRAAAGAGAETGTVDAAKFQAMINRATKPALENLYSQMAKAKIPMGDVGRGTVNELRAAIMSGVPQITQDIAKGLINGLDPKLRESGAKGAKLFINAFKDASGIASPSKVFKQLGEFSADGLEIGFINGLKEFKQKSLAEIKKIVALMKLELASVGDVRIGAGAGAIRAGARGGTQYGAPIGPLPTGSKEPWGRGARGMYGGGGFEPYMAGAGRQLPAAFTRTPGISPTTSIASMLGIGLPALPAAGMSSAAGMRQAELFARESAARARSAERSLAVMQENAIASRVSGQVPLGGGGPFLPPGGPPQGPTGGGGGGFAQFGRAMGQINLPGAGTIRELGAEFAFAAKQVLLFGTAYKALAFIQSFPGEVGQAVGQLQSFRNTLNAVSPSAEEAAASNKLILDLVDQYNIPLQSARDGFTKLYASMAPAGFQGEEIRQLFTGISQAAATFGMSADKVDRVNYAFAQMASKGQVMSEELKGQLGDVLPGAMAIFAEAAGFKGPKAIQDFSAALEEGRYKGEAMVGLLKNVGVVMTQEFGPGAEGAARTFQGSINRMQNSLKLLYEAFEPVAVGFLNSVVTPMTQGIRQVADGVNSFFTGTQARTAGGFALAQELERLRPAFDGIRTNLSALIQQFSAFGKIALEASKILLQIAGNPVVGYLARIYTIVLPLNIALNVMRGLWISNAAQLLIFNARVLAGTSTLTAFRGMMAATGNTAQVTAASIRTAGLTLRTFFASTGVGLVLAGISALIERFMSLNQRLEETKLRAAGAAQAIRSMSATEARTEQFARERNIRDLQSLMGQSTNKLGKRNVAVSPEMASRFEAAGIPVQTGLTGRKFIEKTMIPGLIQQQEQFAAESRFRQEQLKFREKQLTTPPALGAIPPGEGEAGKGQKLQPYDRGQLQIIQQAFDKKKQILDNELLAEKISKTAYGVALANLTAIKEKAEAEETYRLKVLETNRDNMSAADKKFKLFDLEKTKTNELLAVEERRKFAIKKATEEIRSPFKDALKDVNNEIDSQEMQINNLRNGYIGLTAEQEAQLYIQQQTKNLRADEYRAIENTIGALQKQVQIRIENNRLLEQERNLAGVRARISGAGGGLMAGFYGSAAQTYERSLLESNGNMNYAQQMAQLESQAMQLESVFGGIQTAIGGIGDAFGTMMTQGITQLIQGTATAQEVFSSFLKAVGDALLQAAAQMIATYIAIGIAKAFAFGFSSAASSSGSGAQISPSDYQTAPGGLIQGGAVLAAEGAYFTGGFQAFANGGMVTGPTLGLVGEGGEPEYIIPQSKMRGAMERYAAGARGAGVIPTGSEGGGGGADAMAAMMGPIDVRYDVERINSVDYVTADQFQVGLAQAARQGAAQGEQRTLKRLQMSASTRRRVGI